MVHGEDVYFNTKDSLHRYTKAKNSEKVDITFENASLIATSGTHLFVQDGDKIIEVKVGTTNDIAN
jgi:hypothetical protein